MKLTNQEFTINNNGTEVLMYANVEIENYVNEDSEEDCGFDGNLQVTEVFLYDITFATDDNDNYPLILSNEELEELVIDQINKNESTLKEIYEYELSY